MTISRRTLGSYLVGLAAGSPLAVLAQSGYPNRPIRVVVPVGAGGSTDVITRIVCERASPKLGQPIVVENRPGAGGMVGTELVEQAAPDGYTLLMGYASFTLSPHLFRKQTYNPLAFVPITQLATQPIALVAHPSFGPKTLPEVLAWSKANPGKLMAGIATSGSSGHLAMEQLRMGSGMDVTPVIYKSAAANMNALLANEVAVSFTSVSGALPFVSTGRLRFISNFTANRLKQLPDVPTAQEAGFKVLAAGWTGLLGPPKMPQAIADRLHAVFAEVLHQPETIDRLEKVGADAVGNTPAEFAKDIEREFQEFKVVVEKSGMKPN